MAKKQEKQKKVWYYVQPSPKLEEEINPMNTLEEAYQDYVTNEAPETGTKSYAFRIELLGEIENTIKIKE